MQRSLLTALSLALLPLAACTSTSQEHRTAAAPRFYVPTTAVVQGQGNEPGASALAINASQVLPSSDGDEYFVGRPEKFVYGQTVFAESTAFSIFTYDQQLISSLWGPSYRYRYVTQNGITFP